ncbi:P-loop containing nucleoside triphosphate hydrolases superfamily protein [Arabidopsis thaliana]|uniref:Isoform 2 of D-glycerate 3-kinase, chloroplastic n=1 Tax=Arabidopsis thaliana TaxID=3702 RepID=Q944I4-2|nr:P-loop containing nucleoside triphosphate hydrolases superfamily protein [Arabidopsis thaliana]AEE36394.1 P-loop containing nucleoside triphosphate hydrolases superfamily protein [Arabidopsis thaliana]|eukprot:NP_565237.1 P-loop containing nucleoside triphosphate hydrolases superfamily protein [Arabidopsis thaliana]
MAVAISGSSLISSTLQHYNNRIYIRDYPIPCHSSNPICNSFNFKRRSFSPSSPKFNDHVVNPSSSYLSSKLSPIRTHSSFAACGCSWIQDNSMVHDYATTTNGTSKRCSALPTTNTVDVSSVSDLFEFICSGPLVNKIGITPQRVGQSIDKWLLYGSQLCRLFQLNELKLTIPQKARLYHYYIPVFIWCEDQIALHNSKFKDGDDVPRYNKSAYSGRGDRADSSTWPEVEGPLSVILFEGWMLGFKPLPADVVKAVDPQLEVVNKNLEAYYDAWDKYIDAWVVIKIQDPSYVYRWRLQAEIAMRQDGQAGMSDEEVNDFVSRYLPAYKAYLPTLYAEGPSGSDPDRVLAIDIDEERNPILAN